ncbi:MAG: DUF58 domain-containing protein [Tepidisphaeraceae bacterium]
MSRVTSANLIERFGPRGIAAWRWLTSRRRRPPIRDQGPATPVRRRPSVDFSLTGLIYCAMMMFMGLAAINSQANLLFGVFGLMIGILLISALICRLVLAGLRVKRVIPEYVAVGQNATIRYDFFNSKRFWPSLSVGLAELDGAEAFTQQPQAYMLHVAAGKSASAPINVVPKRRGLHMLTNFQISTSFPFGFVKRALMGRSDDAILIYPALAAVDPRLLSLCRSAERGGANMKPRRNGADEFYGVKEFRPGENPRWIHWKRSARTGELVSKEMVQISPPRLLILVDTFIESPTLLEHAAVEKAIAMAASLASGAMDSGMAVGMTAWGGEWINIAPQRGKQHCRDILAALAALPINRTVAASRLVEHGEGFLNEAVTPVLFTPRAMQVSLGDSARGGMIVVPVESEQARTWFRFDPAVDFARCMPAEQAIGVVASHSSARMKSEK